MRKWVSSGLVLSLLVSSFSCFGDVVLIKIIKTNTEEKEISKVEDQSGKTVGDIVEEVVQ